MIHEPTCAPAAPAGASAAHALAGHLVAGLLALALPLLTALPAAAHGTLKHSSPSGGEHLSAVPRTLHFTFTENVEPATAQVTLEGPEGMVELGPATLHSDSASVLRLPVRGSFTAGEYRVRWRVAGTDGHPMRGEFAFFIAPGATGLSAPPAAATGPPPSVHHPASTFPEGPGFDVGSPGYVAIRWLWFVGLLGVIGAVAFRMVLALAARIVTFEADVFAAAAARTANLGLWLTSVLLGAEVLRLLAQSYALHGSAHVLSPGLVGTMVTHTTWGWGWLLQAFAAALALAGFALARRGAAAGWAVAGAAALALAFTAGLSGHAAAAQRLGPLPLLADGLHVLGAAGWLGALVGILTVGVPVTRRLAEPDRARALAAIVNAYSPAALAFAALTVVTGVFATWLHLGSLPPLWQSAYGRTLLFKLGALAAVFATGAYNWLRVRPALGAGYGAGRLRRSGGAELLVGAVVLLVTAVLVATSPPQP